MEEFLIILAGLGLLGLLMSGQKADVDLSDVVGTRRRFKKMYEELMILETRVTGGFQDQSATIFKKFTGMQTMDEFIKTNPQGKRSLDDLIRQSHKFINGSLDLRAQYQEFRQQLVDDDEKDTEEENELGEMVDEIGEYIESMQTSILKPLEDWEKRLVSAQTKSDDQERQSHQGMKSRLMRAEQQANRSPEVTQIYNVLFQTHVDNRQVHFQTIQQNLRIYQDLARSLETIAMDVDGDDDDNAPTPQQTRSITYDSSKRKNKKSNKRTNFAAAPSNAYDLPDPGKSPQAPPKATAKPDFVPRPDAEYGNLTPTQIMKIIERYKKKMISPHKIAKMVKTRISNILKQIENNENPTLQFKNRLQKDYTKMSGDFLLLQAACHYANIRQNKDIPDEKHIFELIQKMEQTYQKKFNESLGNAMKTFDYRKAKANPAYDTQAGTKRRGMRDDDPNPKKKKKPMRGKEDL